MIPELDSAGYTLDKNIALEGQVSFNPDKLEVTGPSSILESYQGKFPVVLNAKKIAKNFSGKVPLEIEEELGNLVQLKQTEIQVSFSIVTYLEGNKRLKIKKLNFPANVKLANEEQIPVLSYLIQEADLPKLKDLEFDAILDYKNRNRSDSTLQIQVSPNPNFLKEVKITPPQFKLIYE